jgi:hypothetical protein
LQEIKEQWIWNPTDAGMQRGVPVNPCSIFTIVYEWPPPIPC